MREEIQSELARRKTNPYIHGVGIEVYVAHVEWLLTELDRVTTRVGQLEGAPGNHEFLLNEFTRLTATYQEQKMVVRQLQADREALAGRIGQVEPLLSIYMHCFEHDNRVPQITVDEAKAYFSKAQQALAPPARGEGK